MTSLKKIGTDLGEYEKERESVKKRKVEKTIAKKKGQTKTFLRDKMYTDIRSSFCRGQKLSYLRLRSVRFENKSS